MIEALSRAARDCAVVIGALVLAGCPPETGLPPGAEGEHWLRIAIISDTQIVDEESPARALRFAPFLEEAWRPQEAYGLQTLDATLRVINARHLAGKGLGRPVDFVLFTGDLCEGAQHNELRWVIDTMDGRWIVPDSGELDGPLRPGPPDLNPKLPFQAAGLDRDIPWYTVHGNHDGLCAGVFGIDSTRVVPEVWHSPQLEAVAILLGLHELTPVWNSLMPTRDQSPAIIRASADPADPMTLELALDELSSGPIVPDAQRHFVDRSLFVEAHFDTLTQPIGHGFAELNRSDGAAWYAVKPKPDVPVRLVVMDTVAPYPVLGFPNHYGVMTREQFELFVKAEIEGAKAGGDFVILVSHHPSADFNLPHPGATVGTLEFRRYLTSRTNIIAHLCGHTHRHRVTRIEGPNPYFEIETGSIIDYPQEGRILDVYYDESADTVRLTGETFSHMEDPTMLSAESFRRAIIAAEAEKRSQAAPEPSVAEWEFGGVDWPKFPGADERYGRPADRGFSIVVQRTSFRPASQNPG
jgi:3',5'-cyclic AMP phosphodiesterase CpdA